MFDIIEVASMNNHKIFEAYKLGNIELKNRIVMSPMTRSRAINNIPNKLMAEYYGQRADAGLIITEGTSPSPNGLGYSRIPGVFSEEQVKGWQLTTNEVHSKGGKIYLQMMHTGRIGNNLNLPEGAVVLAPSAVKAQGQIWTDSANMQAHTIPKEMTLEELEITKNEFINAAKNAIAAGFDGVELHGANGYLLEQFLSPISNIRTDNYGGSIENRCRFVLEVTEGVANAIGKDRTGIRLSPYGVASDMPHYPEIDKTYTYLAEQLNKLGIIYIHLVDHSSMGAPEVPFSLKKSIRKIFTNTLILSGGYTKARAEEDLQSGFADLITFGRPFINNPDLVNRFSNDFPLSDNLDFSTFYTPDEKGYTDYPAYK
jgi:N-ethylmaleimide reductase